MKVLNKCEFAPLFPFFPNLLYSGSFPENLVLGWISRWGVMQLRSKVTFRASRMCSSCSPRLCTWKGDTPDWCKSCPLFLQCCPSSWTLSPLSRIWLPGPLWIFSWLVQPKEPSSMSRALLPLLSEPLFHLRCEISSVFSNCHWYLYILLLFGIVPFSCLFS